MTQKPITLNGKKVAENLGSVLKGRADYLKRAGKNPYLYIVNNPYDPAGRVYIQQKTKMAERIGIGVECISFHDIYRGEIGDAPIIVQLPTHGQEELDRLAEYYVNQWKDVDGTLNSFNIAYLASGAKPAMKPCTPTGIITLLNYYGIKMDGAMVTVIGRSNIVGRPLTRMFEQENATVALCHSKTRGRDLVRLVGMSDIVVAATGIRNLLTWDDAKKYGWDVANKVFVDVGMNRNEDGDLCGDLDPELLVHSKAYTPVPGGVGPMTVISLMENVLNYYKED